jgi:predicted secreted protein
MTITGAFVLFSVTWFMVFFCVLPLRFTSQDEAGVVVPGTPRSAPSDHILGRKAWITTLVAVVVWAAICAMILWSGIGVRDLDVFGIMDGARG